MKYLLLFLISISLVLAVSGCTIPITSVSGDGVSVEELLAEPSELQSNEPFTIKAKLRNSGQNIADDMIVKLYNTGLGNFLDIQCSPSVAPATNCEATFFLLGKDVDQGIEGESKICIWNCIAPDLEKGVLLLFYNNQKTNSYKFSGRAFEAPVTRQTATNAGREHDRWSYPVGNKGQWTR